MANSDENKDDVPPRPPVVHDVWRDPYSKGALLSPDLIANISALIEQQSDDDSRTKQLVEQGYKTYKEAEEITGLDAHAVLQSRARGIDPAEDYTLQGLKPSGGAATVKGSVLVWKHPTSGAVLIHPQLVEGWKNAEVIQKDLTAKGFKSVQNAAQQLGASYMLIYKRATKIEPATEHSPEGLKPNAGCVAMKGSELVWKHPYSRSREGNLLISPTLVEAWHSVFKQQEKLREEGYKTLDEAATITGLDRGGVIETRARKIQADKRYNFLGLEPSDAAVESVLGSELVWRDPYGSTGAIGVLLHPRLIEAWQKDKVEETELRAAGYKTYMEAEQQTGINRRVLEARVALIKPEEKYILAEAEQTTGGIQGKNLVWRSRYSSTSGTSVLLHPCLMEFWKQQEAQEKILIGKGYKTIGEASEITNIPKGTVTARMQKVAPLDDYLPNGLKPNVEGMPTIKGSELVWRGSYKVLLHPELVAGWEAAKFKEEELIKQGYKTTEEAAQIANIDKGTTVLLRASTINPEQTYNLQGQVPKDGDITIQGKELVWKNPYSLSSKTGILIHPQLVESWKNINFWRRGMDEEERALRAKGYVDITHIETQYGISRSFVHHRLDRIEVEKDYSPMGLPPREGDATVKGKDLYWQNPQSNLILIHPTLVSGWHQDIQQEQHLASKGFKRLKEAQELTGIERTTLINRLKTLNPDEDYTPAGLSPTTGSAIVKGKELVWKSAYTDKVTLIHPELIAGWKTAVDQEKKLLAKGYKKSSEIEEITGLSIAQISKRALALDPKEMIEGELITWTDPYSNKRLFHPSIVLRWQSSIEKGAEISKVGNIPVLNDELKRRLEDTNQGKDVGS